MTHSLARRERHLSKILRPYEHVIANPMRTDQWIANSLLQKSIRRGDVEVAQRAALTFLKLRGSAIWRRVMIIAFEDIGAGSIDAVATAVAASADIAWRRAAGGELAVAIAVVELLALAPKSRSAEHLITTANHHPSLEQARLNVRRSSVADNLTLVSDGNQPLPLRALAAQQVSRIGRKREADSDNGLFTLLDTYRRLGVPEQLVVATGIAASRTRETITLMVPLVWLAAKHGHLTSLIHPDLPPPAFFSDLPLYALDKHTRGGREAIRSLIKCNAEIRQHLQLHVPPATWKDVAYMAAFYADAAPLAQKLVWAGGDELECLGTEADMLRVGSSPESVAPLLQVFKNNIPDLNRLRVQVLHNKLDLFDVANASSAEEGDSN